MTNSLSPTAEREAKEREAFEAWYVDFYREPVPAEYRIIDIWQCWLARAALLEPVGEGWVMVPKEPTKEMIDAGHMHTMRADEEEPYRARGEAIACYLDMIAASPKTNGGMGS